MRLLETNGDQLRQGSGVDVLNSDQSIVSDLGSREADRELLPRIILPSRPPSHFIQ